MTQTVDLGDCTVKFDIWDTAGAERYRSLAPMYYRGAVAAVVVFDITNMDSFEGAKSWVTELLSAHSPGIVIALAGNKADLDATRRVDSALARSYAEKNNLLFMETSAKTGQNVSEIFHEIGRRIPKHKKEPENPNTFKLGKTDDVPSSSSWCSC